MPSRLEIEGSELVLPDEVPKIIGLIKHRVRIDRIMFDIFFIVASVHRGQCRLFMNPPNVKSKKRENRPLLKGPNVHTPSMYTHRPCRHTVHVHTPSM